MRSPPSYLPTVPALQAQASGVSTSLRGQYRPVPGVAGPYISELRLWLAAVGEKLEPLRPLAASMPGARALCHPVIANGGEGFFYLLPLAQTDPRTAVPRSAPRLSFLPA